MSLNTYQKRGSVINLGVPGRPWISSPSGSITLSSRLSILGFFAYTSSIIKKTYSRFLTFPG